MWAAEQFGHPGAGIQLTTDEELRRLETLFADGARAAVRQALNETATLQVETSSAIHLQLLQIQLAHPEKHQ
jgi:hypothetical protein